ncbi:MAG: helix-turn-helix domain-containing protein [Candidatus Thiodiazotropha sp.]
MALYKEIIERDQIYLDANISLAKLARQLNTRPYILSDVINASTSNNFNTFINGFRVKHAAKLLVQDESTSVLDIAYASGFNSKSVFYKHFSEAKSMTPAQYRKVFFKKRLT